MSDTNVIDINNPPPKRDMSSNCPRLQVLIMADKIVAMANSDPESEFPYDILIMTADTEYVIDPTRFDVSILGDDDELTELWENVLIQCLHSREQYKKYCENLNKKA